jgi:hypothetical protein
LTVQAEQNDMKSEWQESLQTAKFRQQNSRKPAFVLQKEKSE